MATKSNTACFPCGIIIVSLTTIISSIVGDHYDHPGAGVLIGLALGIALTISVSRSIDYFSSNCGSSNISVNPLLV